MYFGDKWFCRGSPPPMRGEEKVNVIVGGRIRITPAWAGKSRLFAITARLQREHPCMGREKHGAASMRGGGCGTPLHGQGKGHIPHLVGACVRIISAKAERSLDAVVRKSVQ